MKRKPPLQMEQILVRSGLNEQSYQTGRKLPHSQPQSLAPTTVTARRTRKQYSDIMFAEIFPKSLN